DERRETEVGGGRVHDCWDLKTALDAPFAEGPLVLTDADGALASRHYVNAGVGEHRLAAGEGGQLFVAGGHDKAHAVRGRDLHNSFEEVFSQAVRHEMRLVGGEEG